MTFAVKVSGGTNAGCRKVVTLGVAKCMCGGFISRQRAESGATVCLRCEHT